MIEDDAMFVSFASRKAWIYNIFRNTLIQLPDTMESRLGAACGVINDVVVLAGGYQKSTYEIIDISVTNPAWRPGPEDLGYEPFGARMVPVHNKQSLLLVGGSSSDQ